MPDELKARSRRFALRAIKLVVALPKVSKAQLWLELIIEAKLIPARRVQPLLDEASELVSIFVASRKSASVNLKSAI